MTTLAARSVAGPAIGLDRALAALADQDELAVLDGGPGGETVLTWGVAPQPLRTLQDLPIATGSAGAPPLDRPGWPPGIDGGVLVQLDYEFPVGPWALALPGAAVPGRCWPLRSWASWDAAGRCRLHAPDEATLARMAAELERPPAPLPPPRTLAPPQPAWDAAGHTARVERIRAAIAAGDCYQANLTLPWRARVAPATGLDTAIYLRLRASAPGSHGALLRSGGRSVLSHSPECLVAGDGEVLRSHPIKGTRRREPGREAAVRAGLLAAAKDNAELAMIVDLVRNDLARVALPGGVRVESPARVIDLPYVHHLVATVAARLRPEVDARAILAAAFPAGSITGAPKIAAMRLLRALEDGPRGAYCGTIGWLGSGGRCALSVAIRTMVVDGDALRLDAGGGIVADSDGTAEWAEALAKAAPMLAAVGG